MEPPTYSTRSKRKSNEFEPSSPPSKKIRTSLDPPDLPPSSPLSSPSSTSADAVLAQSLMDSENHDIDTGIPHRGGFRGRGRGRGRIRGGGRATKNGSAKMAISKTGLEINAGGVAGGKTSRGRGAIASKNQVMRGYRYVEKQRVLGEEYTRGVYETQVELIQEKYDLMIKRRLIEEHQQMEIRSGADSPSQHDLDQAHVKRIPEEVFIHPADAWINGGRAAHLAAEAEKEKTPKKTSLYQPATSLSLATTVDGDSAAPTPAELTEQEDADELETDKFGVYIPNKARPRNGDPPNNRIVVEPPFTFDEDEIGLEDLDQTIVETHKLHPTLGLPIKGSINPTLTTRSDWSKPVAETKPIVFVVETQDEESLKPRFETSRSAWMARTEREFADLGDQLKMAESLEAIGLRDPILRPIEETVEPQILPPPTSIRATSTAPPPSVPGTPAPPQRSQGYDPVRDTGYSPHIRRSPVKTFHHVRNLNILADAAELHGVPLPRGGLPQPIIPVPRPLLQIQYTFSQPEFYRPAPAYVPPPPHMNLPPPLPMTLPPPPQPQQQTQFFQYSGPPQGQGGAHNRYKEILPAPPQRRVQPSTLPVPGTGGFNPFLNSNGFGGNSGRGA
ncbi:hypothetical protein DID88_007398 [Monilinia fructigena]|uniref:Uncharacterized protein n=1 Tax=Monilinia fructigena TaxID=38457 RepID=A0A395J8B3_9HELO|nr:hypothetical protein DID88_007398 [Monilinia fructigena]